MQEEIERPVKSAASSSSIGDASESDLSDAQIFAIKASYEGAFTRNKALLDEVVFILTERIATAGVKIHLIEHRVKELPSLIKKCQRKNLTNMDGLVDVVGARVVSLFRSDLQRIGQIIAENFEVINIDDKISEDQGALGYLSVHYVCKMPSRYNGPRYENTTGIQFEIQVRTLCMHAWAAVSHYLDYKGDWDVPVELKRSLSALSGRQCRWPRLTRPPLPTPSVSRVAAGPAGIAGPMAVAVRCTTVLPAGIPGRSAAVASATGEGCGRGREFPPSLLSDA